MSAHTPAPWSVDYVIDGDFQISAVAEGDQVVIVRRNVCPARHAEFVANAHLIAAAPDLLEALKALIFPMQAWNEAVEAVTGEQPEVSNALQEALAAIAKAEGR